ncbi:MAG: DUF1015 family protein, partial [Flavobacteriales bacterium]
EATLTEREGVFTRYLEIVGLNAEPVLMSYEGTDPIDEIINQLTRTRAEYEFTTTDLITHELWILSIEQSEAIIQEFKHINSVYIADGHHRSASSVALYEKYKTEGSLGKGQYFLAYFVREDALKILEFQRLVKHLNGLSTEAFIERLRSLGRFTPLTTPRKPLTPHEITIYIENVCYSLVLNTERIDENHPTHSLDAELLTQWILRPILGISDLKTSEDIAFVPGNTPFVKILNQVNDGTFKVAFFLFPIPMSAVKKVADHGMHMPPKSTWVEPKLRSGLTIMDIHD